MAIFLKVISALAKIGPKAGKAISWAWAHKAQIINWVNAGYSVYQIVQMIINALS